VSNLELVVLIVVCLFAIALIGDYLAHR